MHGWENVGLIRCSDLKYTRTNDHVSKSVNSGQIKLIDFERGLSRLNWRRRKLESNNTHWIWQQDQGRQLWACFQRPRGSDWVHRLCSFFLPGESKKAPIIPFLMYHFNVDLFKFPTLLPGIRVRLLADCLIRTARSNTMIGQRTWSVRSTWSWDCKNCIKAEGDILLLGYRPPGNHLRVYTHSCEYILWRNRDNDETFLRRFESDDNA